VCFLLVTHVSSAAAAERKAEPSNLLFGLGNWAKCRRSIELLLAFKRTLLLLLLLLIVKERCTRMPYRCSRQSCKRLRALGELWLRFCPICPWSEISNDLLACLRRAVLSLSLQYILGGSELKSFAL
jgi:hypothetical protein